MMNTHFSLHGSQDTTQLPAKCQSLDKERALLESELIRVTQEIKRGLSPAQYEQANALKFGLETALLITKKHFTQSKEK